MSDAGALRYWDENADAFAFTHPLALHWIEGVPKDGAILDYGCGYGRVVGELGEAGWRRVVGVDFAPGMITRGLAEGPGLDLRCVAGPPLAWADASFDLVVLFAVLTSIPRDGDQRAVMAELARLVRPGGLIYVSDYLLQTDARHLARYADGARLGPYGTWARSDGGVFRHHARAWLNELLALFETVNERRVATTTLSGAEVTAIQLLGQRR